MPSKQIALLCILAFAVAQSVAVPPRPKTPVVAAAPLAAPQPISQEAEEVFFNQCADGWVRYKDHCYLYHEEDAYWYVAEKDCQRRGGHLVSIADAQENSFVAKLTYCESAFTGRYAVSVDRLSDPNNYRWTDNTRSNYSAHDFTSIGSIHEPLISVKDLRWNNNVYHARDKYVCKAKFQSGGSRNGTCDQGWTLVGQFCYLMPKDTATFIEATFYCSGRSANLVSIYTSQELRALSLLDLDTYGCPAQTWVGLIKINPCRIDFSTGSKICYKWADRMQDFHNDFPAWHPGHPDNGERINCVLLQDRAMKTVECHERHRFICKKPARR